MCLGRTPHGVRGLKLLGEEGNELTLRSHPTRGAWIEILSPSACDPVRKGRTQHGVRGLKFSPPDRDTVDAMVAPHTGCVD